MGPRDGTGNGRGALVTGLSPQAARLSGTYELTPRTDVRLLFTPSTADAIYAKVVRSSDSEQLLLRFTSTPPAAKSWIESILAQRRR